MLKSLGRPLHISWHIAAVSLGVVLGTALAAVIPYITVADGPWLMLVVAMLMMVVVKRNIYMVIMGLLAGLLLGAWSGGGLQQQLKLYVPYFDRQVILTGKIVDDTVVSPSGDQRMRLGEVNIDQQDMVGTVWISTASRADLKRGDLVSFKGRLGEGFGNLSASMFRAQLVSAQRPVPGDAARVLRDGFSDNVRQAIPEPEASLGVSYLTGQRRALSEDLGSTLRILGLTHLVVASGFHLTVVVSFLRRWLANTSKYLTALAGSLVIVSFLFLTGFSTSMTRASLVAGISLLAWYYGRTVHPVVLLLSVAAITVILDPASVWGDVGWFLSFSAFAGVIILAPLLHHYFWGNEKEPGKIRQIIIATTAAQITTFPVIAFAFGQYSPLALVSNLIILPLVPITMLLTFAVGVVGIVSADLAEIVALPATIILKYMTGITDRLSVTPWAAGEIDFNIPMLIFSYGAILLLAIYLWRRTNHNFCQDSAV